MNLDLKIAIVRQYGNQLQASLKTGICQSRLSYLINEHVGPTQKERETLRTALGVDYFEPPEGRPAA
jgi:hypothetical protein